MEGHRARRGASLDSPEVNGGPFRSILAAAAVAASILVLAGCQEDRSNLIPRDSTERIEAEVEKIRDQVADGLCFEALRAAQRIEEELDGLGTSIDAALLRTLRDGVTQLQIKIQDECVEAGVTDVESVVEESDPVVEPTPPSGGTTTDPEPPQEGQGGGSQQPPEPAPQPEPTPEPPPPTPPDNSGGVSPSATGGSSRG